MLLLCVFKFFTLIFWGNTCRAYFFVLKFIDGNKIYKMKYNFLLIFNRLWNQFLFVAKRFQNDLTFSFSRAWSIVQFYSFHYEAFFENLKWKTKLEIQERTFIRCKIAIILKYIMNLTDIVTRFVTNQHKQRPTNWLRSLNTTHDKELRKEKKDVEEITSLSNFLFLVSFMISDRA